LIVCSERKATIMLELKGLRHAERFVKEQRAAGKDCRWDGWDIVFFRPSEKGRTSAQGVFRNGVFGFDNRSVVNSDGIWEIDWRNVRRTRTSRN
jgi:hypothetical protein